MAKSEDMSRFVVGALPVLVAALTAAGCGGGGTTTVTRTATVTHTVTRTRTVTAGTATGTSATAPCLASALAGAFAAVPGSAGAGQITYRLRLTNQGDSTCFLTGIPQVKLLDRHGGGLPTAVSPAQPGTTTAVRVDLNPGDAATADARFSPDVPGPNEQVNGPCEPKAYTLRVTIGDGTVDAPIAPATRVCVSGALSFAVFTPAA
jgi:hypothetical protein